VNWRERFRGRRLATRRGDGDIRRDLNGGAGEGKEAAPTRKRAAYAKLRPIGGVAHQHLLPCVHQLIAAGRGDARQAGFHRDLGLAVQYVSDHIDTWLDRLNRNEGQVHFDGVDIGIGRLISDLTARHFELILFVDYSAVFELRIGGSQEGVRRVDADFCAGFGTN
jgi:hypothetical protein